MIRVNLSESVTERQSPAVVAVERKVASPTSRLLIISIVVGILTIIVSLGDIISAQMAKSEAERQLEEQRRKAAELEAMIREQKELEEKIKNIEARVEAIKKLRASQAGPSAVLEAIRERFAMLPQLYLESIEQKGDQVTIKGYSPNENVVTQFGRSLEFSSGLFTNLNIETERKEGQVTETSATSGGGSKVDIVQFTIRTTYNPTRKADEQQTQQASVTAQQTVTGSQITKN